VISASSQLPTNAALDRAHELLKFIFTSLSAPLNLIPRNPPSSTLLYPLLISFKSFHSCRSGAHVVYHCLCRHPKSLRSAPYQRSWDDGCTNRIVRWQRKGIDFLSINSNRSILLVLYQLGPGQKNRYYCQFNPLFGWLNYLSESTIV
jgi:hypothetical protein